MIESQNKVTKKLFSNNAGKINVEKSDSALILYKHQEEAILDLNEKILNTKNRSFAGLLVLPTGGGKTLTTAYWLLKNYIDKGKKVLWIAHRHELLVQAKEAFQNIAYNDILKNKSYFNYRVISGIHDKPLNIKPSDDLIISGKDSLNSGFKYLYSNWIKQNKEEIFLIIDEAHHATAKTYRKIIKNLRENVKYLKILGLTATPFRTAESEKGLLKKVFPDDIVYKIDLRTLINRGILSEPVFEEIKTEIDMTKILNEKELDSLKYFDIDSLGADTAETIATNAERNNRIVEHYVKNIEKYKQTIVFALNINNAIALKALFEKKGIKSNYVVSAIRDASTGVSISPKDNKETIKAFKNSELKVLINVNILTEGIDVPKVQTVFLTRPTISPILMTQMIGRGLRGEKAGGTKKAYIVSFIDDWKDKVAWINPEKLFIEKNTDFTDRSDERDKKILRLVSIEKIEEFARIMDGTINTKDLEELEFIRRIPVGIYPFSILEIFENENREKDCEILVYDNVKEAYEDFIVSLPDFFVENNLSEKDSFTEDELEILCNKVDKEFFHGCEKLPGYISEDIKDLLIYYAQKEVVPQFIELKDREKYDITKIADDIRKRKFDRDGEKEYLDKVWNNDEIAWKTFFGYDKRYFINEVDLAIRKLSYPELYEKPKKKPVEEKELREIEKFSMSELYEKYPEYWRKLRDSVYERYKNKEGYYTCAVSGFKSKNKRNFHIDHINPMSEGGLTTPDNLQILTIKENILKGAKISENVIEWNKKGLDLADNGKYKKAIKCYDKAIEFNPNYATAWFNKGNVLFDIKNYEEAIKCYDKAIELDSDDAKVWFFKGLTLGMIKKNEEAIKCYDKAIELDPDDATAYASKGFTLYIMENYEEAIASYDEALKRDPENAELWKNKGLALDKQSDYEMAIKCYIKALELDSNDVSTWFNKGNNLFDIEKYEEAIECYDKVIELDHNNAIAWFNKGITFDELKKHEKSIECYDKAIELDPDSSVAWFNKGITLEKLKKYKKAIECYDKTIKLDSNCIDAKRNKKRALKFLK